MKKIIKSFSFTALATLGAIANAQAQSIILEGDTNPNVSGSSPWVINGQLIVGNNHDGQMTITDGGIVSSDHASVGFYATSTGTITISGNGSKWENEAGLEVGLLGRGTIKITQGGNLYSLYSTVGLLAGSVGTVIVDGSGSEWNNSGGSLAVGSEGEGTLIVSNGGTVLSQYSSIGLNRGGIGTALIQGAGSEWKVTGALSVAGSGQGTFTIVDGGRAVSDRGLIGFYNTGAGAVTVSGQGSKWSITDELVVGIFGNGTMEVANGGNVSSNSGSLGGEPDGIGAVAIDGAGSAWEVAGTLYVGREGSGTLSVSDQGNIKANFIDLASFTGSVGTINIGTGKHAGNLDTGMIFGGAGQATVNFNHIDNIDFASYMGGTLDLNHNNKGTTTLTSYNSYSGTTTINAGTLQAGTFGALSYSSDYVVGAGGTLDLNGYSHFIASLTNSGVVKIGDTPGTLLYTTGNYVGNGGLLLIATTLGDDTSQTDKFIVGGDTSGISQLLILNTGGLGAQTTEGIKVVEVHGASDGTFTLAGRYRNHGENTVVAGAYTYKLYQGSLSDPADGDWYLRSSADDNGYQAGVPVYEVYPQFLLGLNALPTLQQRVGNRYWSHAGNQLISQGADAVTPYAPAEEAGNFTQSNGVWGRMEGSYTQMQPNSSTSGANYDYSAYKAQAGLDGLLHENEQGKLIGGITIHYAHGLASVWSANDSDLGRGRIRSDGYGFGGTLTWYSDNGFYIDNQAQVTWYRSDLSYQGGQEALTDGKNNGFGYALSSEIGKRFTLDDHWSLTPQAQLHYSGVDFDGFTDVFDAEVSKERAASLQARLGLSVDYQNSWRNEQGGLNRSTVYGIANFYNEFLNGTQVDVASVRFTNKSDRLWAGLGLGGTYNWSDEKYSLYGEGSVNTSLSHFGDSYAYKGAIGLRVKW